MRIFLLLGAVALCACGANDDRLTDEQAAAAQNFPLEVPAANDQVPPPPADPPAFAYRAVGTEPGWALTINGPTMTYQGDYGSVKISESTPADFRPVPGTYFSPRLKLTIAAGPCSDGMSDLIYRQTVRLIADGNKVEGCGGGTVTPGGLAGTGWTVTAINGRVTPGGQDYFISFTADALSARFGCNSIGGSWHLNGDHLSTKGLAQTLVGCPEPAASFERLGSAVLDSNMRIEREGGEAMRLVSEAGSIDLKRAI